MFAVFRAGLVLACWMLACAAAIYAAQPAGTTAGADAVAPTDFYPRDEAKEELGRLLFFDKILSGNRNISCASCHHPLTATGDALSLPLGEGALGLGPARNVSAGVPERVPRNSPALFNLGATEFQTMFHDGRVEVATDQPRGFRTPAGESLPAGLDNILAVQAMFPVTSNVEMAGQPGENEIADASERDDLEQIWQILAGRLQANDTYVAKFIRAFDDVESADDITYVHAANAIAAFESAAFRADDSPFDRYLGGERDAMSSRATRGMNLFYGRANCVSCHSGRFQTNHGFAAIGVPQIGPGKGDNLEGYDDGLDDFGRERVTGDERDRCRFRVPTLRNVALTGPWGHTGAYNSLEEMVRHHADPYGHIESYDPQQAVLPADSHFARTDFAIVKDANRRAQLAEAVELTPQRLSDREIAEIVEFLHALTDPRAAELRNEVPTEVPSGIPVAD